MKPILMYKAPPLRVEHIHFAYGSTSVLKGLSLECRLGELLGIVGANGAGKTTLLKLLAGALKPDQGVVQVHGVDVGKPHPRDRAKLIAMVPQDHATPRGFTALQMVLMGRNPHLGLLQWEGRRDIEVVLRALSLTGAQEFAGRTLDSLSGGEQQRVLIARALAQETPLLLLDEPTAHLDISYQSGILEVVRDVMRDASVTAVAAIHDLTLAAQYCDRLAVLDQGRLVALGSPKEVLTVETVSRAFSAEVCVVEHPIYGTPVVLHGGRRPLRNGSGNDAARNGGPNVPGGSQW